MDKEKIVNILYKFTAENADKVIGKLDEINNKLDKGKSKSKNELFDTGKIALYGKVLKETTQKVVELTKVSSDYIETLNVLNVAFNGNTEDIRKFTSTIADTLNLDDSTLIKTASSFKTLANSMNYTNDVGEKFSKLFTQMTVDVSSLYNLDFDRTRNMLQTALMGQGKMLKQTTGASTLETTVQTTLDVLGIDAYVSDMNDAEKAMARAITMTYQLRNSQGDLARTIESPANQFRILGEQIALAGRNIGNIFLPMMAKILPYVNAVMIVINELLSMLAKLVGYKETKWDFDVDTESISAGFEDLGGAIGGVGEEAENTRQKLLGLRGFDKLNVIKTPTESKGSDASGGGAGGINPNLLNAFDKIMGNYDSKLKGIKTRAQEIADNIMKWLGFTKDADTGAWKFDHVTLGTVLGTVGLIGLGIGVWKKTLGLLKFPKKFLSNLGKAKKGVEDTTGATKLLGFSSLEWTGILGSAVVQTTNLVHQTGKVKGKWDETKSVWESIKPTSFGDFLSKLLTKGTLSNMGLLGLLPQAFLEIAGAVDWVGQKLGIFASSSDKTKTKVIRDAVETRDKTIAAAEEQYNKSLKEAEKMYQSGEINEETYNKMIEDAKKTKEETIKKANEQYDGVYNKFIKHNKDMADYIDKDTGKVKSKFQVWWESLGKEPKKNLDKIGKDMDNSKLTLGQKWNNIWNSLKAGHIPMPHFNWYQGNETKGLVRKVLKALNLPTYLPKLDVQWYAQGGLPDVGQMFIANERGPELVGQIGGKSFVANQNQMMDIIDKKLSSAGGLNNATFVIQVGDEQVAKKVLKDLNGMAKANGKPITISG